jgi:hypothetical protein
MLFVSANDDVMITSDGEYDDDVIPQSSKKGTRRTAPGMEKLTQLSQTHYYMLGHFLIPAEAFQKLYVYYLSFSGK